MKITNLQIENVKRVKAVSFEPAQNGLTVIGGRNKQGKTSVLDAIAWGLGGDRYKPSIPQREDALVPPNLRIELDNGIIVERKGKNSALTVTDANGKRAGQSLLDSLVEKLALDLPAFMNTNNKEKANILLEIIGVKEQLEKLRDKEQMVYQKRHAIGILRDQKNGFVEEMPHYPDAPQSLISPSDLIQKHQAILAKNGENQKKRENAKMYTEQFEIARERLAEAQKRYDEALANLEIASKSAADLQDESTLEIEDNIRNIEQINIKVRANFDREKAIEEASLLSDEYNSLTAEIETVRKNIFDLLKGANLPLKELSVSENGFLIYKGQEWDNMSGSEQLCVATSIVRKLKPECKFVLIDKLEQMDLQTMQEFGAWLEGEEMQAICTRVSTGAECQIIIEDGLALEEKQEDVSTQTTWKEGVF